MWYDKDMTITFHSGRLPNDPEKPRLLLEKYSTATDYPNFLDYLTKVDSFPMYLNDNEGDCTIAGGGHIIEAESAYGQGFTQKVTDSDVQTAYVAVSGYNPKTGANDNGAVMQDVLSYWRKTGIGGHKILAFAQVDHKNQAALRSAMNTFGSLYIGINFPGSAMDQFNEGKPWDVVKGATLEGGHCIHGGAYQVGGNWKVVTWGAVQEMTQAFWDKYVEEAWIVVTPEWLNANGDSPTGLNLYALGEDLAALTGGENPFQPGPAPQPTPTPVEDADQVLQDYLTNWFSHYSLSGRPALRKALEAWLDSRQ